MNTTNTSFSNAFLPNLQANKPIDISKWQSYRSYFYESPYKVFKKWIKAKVNLLFWDLLYTTAKRCEYYALQIETTRFITKNKKTKEKFTDLDILIMASLYPRDLEINIMQVSNYYPTLSKRQVCRVILEKKSNYPTWFKTARWIEVDDETAI